MGPEQLRFWVHRELNSKDRPNVYIHNGEFETHRSAPHTIHTLLVGPPNVAPTSTDNPRRAHTLHTTATPTTRRIHRLHSALQTAPEPEPLAADAAAEQDSMAEPAAKRVKPTPTGPALFDLTGKVHRPHPVPGSPRCCTASLSGGVGGSGHWGVRATTLPHRSSI